METLRWNNSTACTLMYYAWRHQQGDPSAPEWEPLIPRIAAALNTTPIGPVTSLPTRWALVDALDRLGERASAEAVLGAIPEPVRMQVENELSLRTSQLKHHWLTRGPGIMAALNQALPLSELMAIDLWAVVPAAAPLEESPPATLFGQHHTAALLPVLVHDTDPQVPTPLRVAHVACFFALLNRVLPDDRTPKRLERVELAAVRLAIQLGAQVDWNRVDEYAFTTAARHWLADANVTRVAELWQRTGETEDLPQVVQNCLDWIE